MPLLSSLFSPGKVLERIRGKTALNDNMHQRGWPLISPHGAWGGVTKTMFV